MQINRCSGCMQDIESYPCPHCGYSPERTPQPEYALACDTILHGRYLIGKVLGQGGFGITYVGWDLALEIKVAIKEYYPSGQVMRNTASTTLYWNTTPQARELRESGMETFIKEARKMARVERIPEVVRVRDTFADNETAYIIMDFVDGQTLMKRLEQRGVLSWEESKKIFFPVISAMGKVHKEGLVHRDLSPDNLMLTSDGEVSILDLGAAKDLTVNSGASSMQVAKGGFSPIEQYTQRGGSGPWTDVYALAATMYYALTGVLPPTAIDRLQEDTLRWDLPRLSGLPGNVKNALKRALTILPKERTQSMADFLKELETPLIRPQPAPEPVPVTPKEEPKFTPPPVQSYADFAAGIAPKPDVQAEKKKKSKGPVFPRLALFVLLPLLVLAAVLFAANRKKVEPMVAAGLFHTVGLRSDGTVVTAGSNDYGQCDVDDWKNITYVSTKAYHTVGLTAQGTVKAVGANKDGQCDVDDWKNIAYVSAGNFYTVGVKKDGTVVATGDNEFGQCDVDQWRDIKAVSAGTTHTVGLRKDGTVVAVGDNEFGQCDVSDWTDIVAVSAGWSYTVGLKSDGTVVAVGTALLDECDVSGMWNIVDISAGLGLTVGVQSDGNVCGLGFVGKDHCDFSEWRDITDVSVGGLHTVGLRSDGSVVATGDNEYGQCDVSDWNLREKGTSSSRTRRTAGTTKKPAETEPPKLNFTQGLVAADLFNWAAVNPDGTVCRDRKGGPDSWSPGLAEPMDSWTDIVSISAGPKHFVGLKSDGTVVAAHQNDDSKGCCNVSSWTNITAVVCGPNRTVGLRSDGTVVVTSDFTGFEKECDVSGWSDIVAIAAGDIFTAGLKSDGTVITTDTHSLDSEVVAGWRDIKAIYATSDNLFGIKKDGTVVVAGRDYMGRSEVSGWTDIVAIAGELCHTIGLKSDGTVVATGDNEYGRCNVSEWKNVVSIAANFSGSYALTSDGKVLSTK